MNLLKRFAWSGSAVAMAVVISLSALTGTTPRAEASTAITAMVFPAAVLPNAAQIVLNTAATATNGATAGTAVAGNAGVASTASTMTAVAGQTGVVATTQLVLTESLTAQLVAGTAAIALPAGYQYTTTGTCVVVNAGGGASTMTCLPTLNATGTTMTLTVAGGSTAGVNTITFTGTAIRASSNTATSGVITIVNSTSAGTPTTLSSAGGFTGSVNSTLALLAAGSVVGTVIAPTGGYTASPGIAPYTTDLKMVANSTACGTTNPVSVNTSSFAADGSISRNLCATVYAADGGPVVGQTITFTVSTGTVSTGTAKTSVAVTNAAGNATMAYRGAGNAAATDTAIASATQLNTVGTLNITLTAPTGSTASKITLGAVEHLALGSVTTGTAGYMPTRFGTTGYAQVVDSASLGVTGQTVLISVDRGGIIAGIGGDCSGGAVTARSITTTTSASLQGANGSSVAGTANFTLCSNSSDAVGVINVTAQNISTSMATAATKATMAGLPSKIDATAVGGLVTARVTDASGNLVADGTPVRFTISSTAGALSSACSPTSNGTASSVVALTGATGSVIVSVDWNESGSASACNAVTALVAAVGPPAVQNVLPTTVAATGSKTIVVSVSLPGGAAPVTAGAATVSGTVPATGFGLIVASGKITDVVTAVKCAGTSSALYATVGGEFVAYVPVTTIAAVNAAFLAAFKDGVLPASTALIGKC